MKYYFVSYKHKDGFGSLSIRCKSLNFTELQVAIERKTDKGGIVILFFQRITKKEFKAC